MFRQKSDTDGSESPFYEEEQVVAFADLLVVHSISPLRTRLASVM